MKSIFKSFINQLNVTTISFNFIFRYRYNYIINIKYLGIILYLELG